MSFYFHAITMIQEKGNRLERFSTCLENVCSENGTGFQCDLDSRQGYGVRDFVNFLTVPINELN